jgi:radical SAM superfamily enzyme YgiQ (UPF0313 family)
VYQLNYIEPVFRPPSEWRSLILQITNGCSWNRCTFCEMYQSKEKQFSHKSITEIEEDLAKVVASKIKVRRIFLADGDVMTLSFRRLEEILIAIKSVFPDVQRISAYCLPRNLLHKSVTELNTLQALGLQLLYVGCESGDNEVLNLVDKGESYQSQLDALTKIKLSGIKSSVMILNGLGGQSLSEQHAIHSAELMNESQPDYLSTLVVSFPQGMERYQTRFNEFKPLKQENLFTEMHQFLSHLELDKTVFRSDHASNYLVLKGILGRDKEKLIQKVEMAINKPSKINIRQESQRGL